MTRARSRRHRDDPRGQSVVEFILVLPLFLFLLMAIIEFAFAFTTLNGLGFAARDVARVGVEGGERSGTDCTMLTTLESVVGASSNRNGIDKVDFFWSDDRGNMLGGAVNTYDRTGTWTCTTIAGSSVTLPYSATSLTYPETDRCVVLAGCGGLHTSVDTLGVRITYQYGWKTPLASMLQLGTTLTLRADQQMRIEPVL